MKEEKGDVLVLYHEGGMASRVLAQAFVEAGEKMGKKVIIHPLRKGERFPLYRYRMVCFVCEVWLLSPPPSYIDGIMHAVGLGRKKVGVVVTATLFGRGRVLKKIKEAIKKKEGEIVDAITIATGGKGPLEVYRKVKVFAEELMRKL